MLPVILVTGFGGHDDLANGGYRGQVRSYDTVNTGSSWW